MTPVNIVTEPDRPGPLAIARAVPRGSRRAAGQRAWLKDVYEAIADAEWRTDRRENWESVARIVAHCADWRTRCTMPLWHRLGDRAGRVDAHGERRPLSRSTVARALAWLREQGFLGVVESGSTPWLRPMALSGTEGNRAAVYVLATPGRHASRRVVRVNDTPSRPRSGLETHRARARGSKSSTERRPSGTHPKGRRTSERTRAAVAQAQPVPEPVIAGKSFSPQPGTPAVRRARPAAVPQNRTEEVAAAAVVMNGSAAARSLTDRHVAHICRDFFRAGWSPADILRAIDYQPGGQQWHMDASVLHAAGWMRSRLNAWRTEAGVMLSPATTADIAAAAVKERQLEQRAEAEKISAAAAGPVGYAAGAAAARAALAAASPRAAQVIALRSIA